MLKRSAEKMKTGYAIGGLIVFFLLGCHSTPDPAKRPMADWDSEQISEYRFSARCAVHEVYRKRIILPLGKHDWSNKEFRSYLENEYGLETVNATEWTVPRFAGYNDVMKAAAEEKLGERWWTDAVMKFFDVPIPN